MPAHAEHDTSGGETPLLEARHLSKSFLTGRSGLGRRRVNAVDGISLELHRGEALGIVGESGCGKSTLARMLVGLESPDNGDILVDGHSLSRARGPQRRTLRRRVQMVFQDPYTSLDPRMTLLQIVGEPMAALRGGPGPQARRARVQELLGLVGLSPDMLDRYPHQFSGGQRQRIGIARALAVEPDVVVCDEPVSALDVSVQAQVVNLLHDLQRRTGIALLFIAHDLSVVRHVCHRTGVMYLGRLAETGDTEDLYTAPSHPYTQALLSASPVVDRSRTGRMADRIVLRGDPPSPSAPPTGCRFHTRCRMAAERCTVEVPLLRSPDHDGADATGTPRQVACHFAEQALGDLAG